MEGMSDSVHPAHSPERAAFRNRFAVRLVTVMEEGSDLRRLPDGVYGYTTAGDINELPVFIKPIYQCFEVHKLAGGEICFVGYLTEKEYQAFQGGTEALTVALYPEAHEDSTTLVSVPMSRIDRAKPPSRDDGNWMKLEVSPKAEFLGISGRAN